MDNLAFERLIVAASTDTEQGAEIVARTFYRTLRKNGFTERQVICVATNIISYLTDSLKGYEDRIEQNGKEQKQRSRTDSENLLMGTGKASWHVAVDDI